MGKRKQGREYKQGATSSFLYHIIRRKHEHNDDDGEEEEEEEEAKCDLPDQVHSMDTILSGAQKIESIT